ncbi:hypothetical protein [Stratiformator vulcanicus]|uniref:Uncharacterized protein n=1 Tax=Stratiformator vulcanicus TaxID=2527980 RepID=A0A517R3Y4_9PLAN|nr:hypothetical protein [Stratiformator vulcanicus]QDT38553.1 hypothetical protein Pan189_29480 [Stratiformator vulcanicus]
MSFVASPTLFAKSLIVAGILTVAATVSADFKVTDLGKQFSPSASVIVSQPVCNTGGNTSVRNFDRDSMVWKDKGYYQRSRDLGQTFTAPRDFTLQSIVLRTGPAHLAVLPGTPNAPLFVQFFEIIGEPVIDDNGTPRGTKAKHGFSKNHRCDDFIEGIEYRSIAVVKGAVFPDMPLSRNEQGVTLPGDDANFRYMRWAFTGEDRLSFEEGRRYAFMVGFAEPGDGRNFTLANSNAAARRDKPAINGKGDLYGGGWAIRREGDGTLPPDTVPGADPPKNTEVRNELISQSLFGEGEAHYKLSPTTEGYPDVDTYRDLEFYLEASDADGE